MSPKSHYKGRQLGAETVLQCLLDNGGLATQDTLIDALWGEDPEGGPLCAEDVLRQHIHCLRKKLKPGWDIHNIFNHSYKLVQAGAVEEDDGEVDAYVDEANDLRYDGKKYHLTPTQALIMRLLLTGRPIRIPEIADMLWPNDADLEAHTNPVKTIHVHIHQMRLAQPLSIRNIPCVGYLLEPPLMTDKPRPPEVEQTLSRARGVLSGEKGADLSDLGLTPGPRTYDGDTGSIKASNDKVEVEIKVKPKND